MEQHIALHFLRSLILLLKGLDIGHVYISVSYAEKSVPEGPQGLL